ncbi:hypothetical protein D9X30_1212 [Cupriavidus sp. U2]|nr:hypothetical protein D9X30_1212 [Cupriavidus sp. U2]
MVVASSRKIGKTSRPRFPDHVILQQARPPFYSARHAGTARRPERCNVFDPTLPACFRHDLAEGWPAKGAGPSFPPWIHRLEY